jgi:hypothetical protein
VRAAGQQAQCRRGIGGIARLAEDAAAQRDRGVGAEDRRGGQVARDPTRPCGGELRARDPLDIVQRRLASAFCFKRFDVFVGTGQQQLMADADLVEQLAPARTLRCEVDEGERRR